MPQNNIRGVDEINSNQIVVHRRISPSSVKVPQLSPMTSATEQDVPSHDNLDTSNNCSSKRRRFHLDTNIVANGDYRHRKHLYPPHDDKSSSSMDCFDTISNNVNDNSNSCSNSCNSGEDASDFDSSLMTPITYLNQQHPAEGETSSPSLHHNKKDDHQQTTVVNNNNYNNDEDCATSAISHQATNDDSKNTLSLSTHIEKNKDSETTKTTHEPTISPGLVEQSVKSATNNEKNLPVEDTDFDDPTISANHCINSLTSNDDFLSQSPLNLTRSRDSSEYDGNKSEEDEGEYDDDSEEKNNFSNVINDDENIVNGHNLGTTEAPFPWSITTNNNNNNNNNKQKQNNQDDKIPTQPPQLLLTSGHLTTGCLQAAQLLIPTARGVMTQTILAIPINDMVSSAMSSPNQQQLLYQSAINVRQKNINRQHLNQNCQPSSSLPLNRYFHQNQTTTDDSTNTITATPENVNNENNSYDILNNGTIVADQYNNIQRRKWQTLDLNSKKHNFLSPKQKNMLRNKNRESGESINVQRTKESFMIQNTPGTNGDGRVYSTNNIASTITAMAPMSPTQKRNGNSNGSGVDATQRQTVWPTAVTATDQQNSDDENDNEGKLFIDDKQQPNQSSHTIIPESPTSSLNINTLKQSAQPPSQLNCPIKQSKDDDSASAAAAAAAAYNQQNAICTALATHMLCASQLAAAQQPMFDNLDSNNTAKKSNNVYNNNNNNMKTNNMMGVVNPAVLENWMMEERYYYNNNNNNNKNIAGTHHQRYNAAAAAAAAAAAVELLSGSVSASSSGGGGDSLASCKKRKRRTSFTPQALELLNGHFERNTHPSGSEITGLAHRLGYEREVIRIWFCNKRQALKNTVRTINGSGHTHMTSTKSHNNTSGY